MSQDPKQRKVNAKLIAALRKLIKAEDEAREKFGLQGSLKFIPVQLRALLERYEKEFAVGELDEEDEDELKPKAAGTGQVPVFIYLYHAQGQKLDNWLAMLTPKALNELATTRPIYAKEEYLSSFLRDKLHQPYFAYIAIYVDESEITAPDKKFAMDRQGNPLIRVKEGALKVENLVYLRHNTLGRFIYKKGEFIKEANDSE